MFLSRDNKLSQDNNLFAWYDDYSLEKMGGTNLNAFHFNPYLKAVAILSDINYNLYKWDGYSKLQIRVKITEFYCKNDGWIITFSSSLNEDSIQKIVTDFNLEQYVQNKYILKHNFNEDIIENAINFIIYIKKI